MFKRGDFIQRKIGEPIRGIVIGPGRKSPRGKATVKVYRIGTAQKGAGNWYAPNYSLVTRPLSDDEWAEFVKFLLTEGE